MPEVCSQKVYRIATAADALTSTERHIFAALQHEAARQGSATEVSIGRRKLEKITGANARTLSRVILSLTWKHAVTQISRGNHRDRPSCFRLFDPAESWDRITADATIGKGPRGEVFVTMPGRHLMDPAEIQLHALDSIAAALVPYVPAPEPFVPRPPSSGRLVGWFERFGIPYLPTGF